MVIEIQVGGKFYYAKADIPPDNLEDLRALKLEETLQPTDPDDLFAKLELVTPHQSSFLRRITQGKDAFIIDGPVYKQLPQFDWQQIMNFGKDNSWLTWLLELGHLLLMTVMISL